VGGNKHKFSETRAANDHIEGGELREWVWRVHLSVGMPMGGSRADGCFIMVGWIQIIKD
jgi:hypothetical protein